MKTVIKTSRFIVWTDAGRTDFIELWRASGKGWQTRAAAILAKYAPKN